MRVAAHRNAATQPQIAGQLGSALAFWFYTLAVRKINQNIKKKHNYFIHRSFVLQYRGTMIYILLFSISFVDCFYGSYLR